MKPQIKAIYLSVEDMNRAISFYEEVLNIAVSSREERMSSFDLGNITLLLYNPKIDGDSITFGSNIVPDIEVDSVKEMLNLVKSKGCEVVMPITKIGGFEIFQIKDTEGNIIEFYQVSK